MILKCLAKNPAARYQTGEELAQDLATLRVNPNATLASLAPATIDPNATLAAAPSSISHPPAQAYSTTQKAAAAQVKKLSKPLKREIIVAVALLAVAAGACAWFLPRLFHPHPVPPQPPVVVNPTPAPTPIAPFGSPDLPPAPAVPITKTPVTVPAIPGKPTPSKPATTQPQTATQQTTTPPATKPAPASTPAANTTPPPAAKPAKTTTPPATPATAATDPHKLDPNANSKFKIELSHMPNGVPLTVEMNKTVYLRFISGDKTDLNNLFVPPGTQTFRVIAQNGGQQVDSNIVSSEFKAKKKKNLKIEMQNQGSVPAGAAAPLSPGAKIYVSLSTPIF